MKQFDGLKKQRGMSFISLLFVLGLFIFFIVLGIRLVPVYMENQAVEKIINDIESSQPSIQEAKTTFDKRASIEYIDTVRSKDLEFAMEDGSLVVHYEYEKRVSLVSNLSLVVDFTR